MIKKLKNKLQNCEFNYAKNFYKFLIVPAIVLVLSLILALTVGFNKGLDYKGGLIVSVTADTNTDLTEKENYNEFKDRLDNILSGYKVRGNEYTVEVNEQEEYVMVVKIDYKSSEEKTEKLISELKLDLIDEFFPVETTNPEDVENNYWIMVNTFGPSANNSTLLYVALATLICALAMAAYIGIRVGLNAGVISLLSSIFNVGLTLGLIMITRIPVNRPTLAVIPFTVILSALTTMLFYKKAKDMITLTENYARKSNKELANDLIKENFDKILIGYSLISIGVLVVGLLNIVNSVLFMSFALFESIIAVIFTTLFILPGFFALTFIRKIKRTKQKKEVKSEEKLTEEEVLKETDLDNLVSN